LERFGEKSATNLLKSIEQSKSRPLPAVIYALGIPNTGEYLSRILAEHFSSLDRLMNASRDELDTIEGIGPIVAEGIVTYFSDERNRELIKALQAVGINPKIEKQQKVPQIFEGKTVVFTGTLTKFTRDEAKELVRTRGGNATESVSRKTDFVVAGPGAGSKLDKAKELGIKILTEEEFLTMLNNKKEISTQKK
jgi:DNA ligase (NAD+)